MRAIARQVAILAGLVGLAACAITPPGGLPSRSSASPTALSSSQPTATPDVSAADELLASGDAPELLDPSLIDPILAGIETRSENTRHLFANWPHFGRPAIDKAISDYFNQAIEDFRSDYPEPDESTTAPPEFNLGWHLIASSPQLVGIISDGYLLAGASSESTWHSLWFDPGADAILPPSDLVDADATNRALRTAALAGSAVPGLDLRQVEPDPLAAAAMLAFSRAGELLVGYDECEVAACAAGRVTVTIPSRATEGLLTEAGRIARQATSHPVSPLATQPVPSTDPTASPSATASPSGEPGTSPPTGKVDCRKAKCIALTFDDGPGRYTAKLLAHLSKANAPATFFMLGQQVETYPKVAKAVAAAGHEIGVHTWSHRSLPHLPVAQIDTEITSTAAAIRQVTGRRPTLLRPPYGASDATVAARAKHAGLALVMWSVDTLDWKTRDTKKTVAATLKQTRRGSIILVHDIHKSTVAAVPEIIAGLRKKGYTFVTVSQLIGKPRPGRTYFHG